MIIDIIDVMRALEFIQGSSSLSDAEKRSVALELKRALPALALCHSSQITHGIVSALCDKAVTDKTVSINGTSPGEPAKKAGTEEEISTEEHQLPPVRARQDGIPGDAGKAYGRPKKVSGGRR